MKLISTPLTVVAMLITIAGSVALVWLQADTGLIGSSQIGDAYRWQLALMPMMVMGIGLVLIAVAQILRIVAARFEDQTTVTSPAV